MILSASRRTDIPAFYSEWFINRLREGYVLIPNPYNTNQLSRISLSPQKIDCIVFWTKNALPLLRKLDVIYCFILNRFFPTDNSSFSFFLPMIIAYNSGIAYYSVTRNYVTYRIICNGSSYSKG